MTDKLCKISLFSAMLTCIAGMPSSLIADSRIKGTYATAYNQVMEITNQQAYADAMAIEAEQPASATATLPIEVEDARLAEDIKNNKSTSVTMSDLEECSMIDIRGVFKWGTPQSGNNAVVKPQCVAVVDLIDVNVPENDPNRVLATTTVAAGDMMKCNIDMFPESGYKAALENVILPADEEPTMKDVEKALNKEQKKGAGIKIAAAALIGGLAGNMLAPKPAGNDKLVGASKTQLVDTAIGALSGAGVMAASSYTGKVAGDTIKSTAVNAATGMLIGNMAAGMSGSDSVLSITKCSPKDSKKEYDCILGRAYKISGKSVVSYMKEKQPDKQFIYFTNKSGGTIYVCEPDGEDKNMDGDGKNCTNFSGGKVVNIGVHNKNADYGRHDFNYSLDLITNTQFNDKEQFTPFFFDPANSKISKEKASDDSSTVYYRMTDGYIADGASTPVYAVFEKISSKTFGYKVAEFDKIKEKQKFMGYYDRNNDGTVGGLFKNIAMTSVADYDKQIKFTPMAKDASDGGIIDLSNEARAKATLAGAGAGGALGGFAGYQGAQSEIAERYATALNEYRQSLSDFACVTGKRFLNFYNKMAEIPTYYKSSNGE